VRKKNFVKKDLRFVPFDFLFSAPLAVFVAGTVFRVWADEVRSVGRKLL
jgi:hypothetical protein